MDVRGLVEQLLPRHCVLCRARCNSNLCTGCDADLPAIGNHCYRCGIPLDLAHPGNNTRAHPDHQCGQCIKKPPPFDRTIPALDYVFPVNVLVQRFKFRRSFACGAVLSDRLLKAVKPIRADQASMPELLVPVPLHPLRQFTRVYNQAELIAFDISRNLGIPVRPGLLRRTRRTRSQPGLNAAERQKNLKGSIKARCVNVKHLAVVDDVMTTGATVSECATALKNAGVEYVSVWVAARAPDP